MLNRAIGVLCSLQDAPVITVEPGFMVEARTSHGIHDDEDDLAFSVGWRDAEGCQWAADFSESALADAQISGGTVRLYDTEGATVIFRLFQVVDQVHLPSA